MSDQVRAEYRTRLGASIDCTQFLLRQGLAFRDMMRLMIQRVKVTFLNYCDGCTTITKDIEAATLKNAPNNLKLIAPDTQKDIVNCIATEIVNLVIRDVSDKQFSILIDKSKDISSNKPMSVVLRYVDEGHVIEQFIGIIHINNTRALSLKEVIDGFFSQHGLSIANLRGRGYDGASNMQVNVIGASATRRDILREKHSMKNFEALNNGEISSGRGLNQEIMIKRPGDTRWGSHYNTLTSLVTMFSSVVDVLETIMDSGSNSEQKYEARILMTSILLFDFVFNMHLMKNILGITNDLSQVLQRKYQDIVNAMNLVNICKGRLQAMRESVFYTVIDMQLQELNNRFTESSTELLLCMACLNLINSFAAFDKQKLSRLAQFYPRDFSAIELSMLEDQLQNYIIDMRSEFVELKNIGNLAVKMVVTKRDKVNPLVYRLLTLALILSVATATVERTFSAMNIVKTQLHNRMGDQWMNDCLIAYIEKDLLDKLDNKLIMD
ncbi:uncharacterized protein LOC107991537 [Cucumis melo]|uniref:Uncharacterized protein LOC107991537 n=1 Tax=Cucumis melo TaxID=3656 RepID=A0A1S4E1J9_CUCME|nr:uncharacterized protein LOC107991537 [Cucumis melo]